MILAFVCLCSLQRLNLCLIKIVDVNNPLVIKSARSVPQLHWWYNQPSLCHSSSGDTVSQVCSTAPLVIKPAKSVPQPHWWYSQQGLCHNSTGDKPVRSVPHFCYSFTGFSPWRLGFAPKVVHVQFVVDGGRGTGFSLKYFLCQHLTMTPFPFICYLQDVHWACERLVVWRHTCMYTKATVCLVRWTFATLLHHEGFPATCSIPVKIFSSHVCGWQTFVFRFLLHYFYFQTSFISVLTGC